MNDGLYGQKQICVIKHPARQRSFRTARPYDCINNGVITGSPAVSRNVTSRGQFTLRAVNSRTSGCMIGHYYYVPVPIFWRLHAGVDGGIRYRDLQGARGIQVDIALRKGDDNARLAEELIEVEPDIACNDAYIHHAPHR